MIKIAVHNVQKYGARGAVISLPKVWMSDNHIKQKQPLPIYRLTIDGNDFLIITPKEATINLETILKSTKLINKNTPEINEAKNSESSKN